MEHITEALEAGGIIEAFPIQAMTLPVALPGGDVIGQAKTGTGKTLAFGIPVLQRVAEAGRTGFPSALVVVPTRELAVQVARDLGKTAARMEVVVTAVYGGRAYEPQIEALRAGADVVVGTPGRLLDLAEQRHLRLDGVRALVLDEADEMLDLGFLPDVERILAKTSPERQTMLFSATMPGAVLGLARRYLRQPTNIRAFDPTDEGATVARVEQHIFRAHSMDKPELLARVLQAEGRGLTIVFCTTKRAAAKVADDLVERGFAAGAVHGDLGQGAREQALRAFRSGKVDVLVATDVAARGIDVEGVTHVVNYSCPDDEKTYLHRIGRTARAGAAGVAVTLVDWADTVRWSVINKALGLSFYEPVETYSTSAHLADLLGIPPTATGVLPRAQRTRAGLGAEEIEDLGETGRRERGGRAPNGRSPRPGGAGRSERNGAPAQAERRGRTDRSDRSDRTDGSDIADGIDPAGEERADLPPRAPRQRRRLRAGAPLDGAPGDPVEPPGTEGFGLGSGTRSGTGVAEGADGAEGAGAEGTEGASTARRRRRRGGRGRTRPGSAPGAGDATAEAHAVEAAGGPGA